MLVNVCPILKSVSMRSSRFLLPFLLLLGIGCGGDGDPVGPPGSRTFQFVMRHRPELTFRAVTSDPEVISDVEAQLVLPAGERTMHLNGAIARGNGGHNAPWSWHFSPGQWTLEEVSAEVCDGSPDWLEENLEEFLAQLDFYCPWDAIVDREVSGT